MLRRVAAWIRGLWEWARLGKNASRQSPSPMSFRELFSDVQGFLESAASEFPVPSSTSEGWGLYFCTKAFWVGEAIQSLCESDLATEARILLRALTDHYITARYILADATKRGDQFAAFDAVERMRRIRAVRDFNIHGFSEKQLREWESAAQLDYASVENRFLTSKGKVTNTWHGSNLRTMAKEVDPDLEKLYVYLFRDTSESVHPSNRDTRHYFRVSNDGRVSAALMADAGMRADPEVVLLWACLLNTHLSDHLNDAFQLGHAAQIRTLEERRISILDARKTAGI